MKHSYTAFLCKVVAALLGVLLVALSVVVIAPAADAQSASLAVRRGSIGDEQSVAALAVQDQSGNQDAWLKYVEFIPDAVRHKSVLFLPVEGANEADAELSVKLNYRGPDWNFGKWVLDVYDYDASAWVRIYTNRDVDAWVWSPHDQSIGDADRFVRGGLVKARYGSWRNSDVSQLDSLIFSTPGDEPPVSGIVLPTANAGFDYQLGEDYPLRAGVSIVARDWFGGSAAPEAYSICYVNAFQNQADSDDVDRPDELSNWPARLVLTELGDDPGWTGEYLVDISTFGKRRDAAAWVAPMVDECAAKGFDAVEFDNLDSWTRFDDIPADIGGVPFGQSEAVAYATLITNYAHDLHLAVAQKNTVELIATGDAAQIGFDFVIAEQCGQYRECGDFMAGYGDLVFAIEYGNTGFNRACNQFGDSISVIRRDRNLVAPGNGNGYRYQAC